MQWRREAPPATCIAEQKRAVGHGVGPTICLILEWVWFSIIAKGGQSVNCHVSVRKVYSVTCTSGCYFDVADADPP